MKATPRRTSRARRRGGDARTPPPPRFGFAARPRHAQRRSRDRGTENLFLQDLSDGPARADRTPPPRRFGFAAQPRGGRRRSRDGGTEHDR